jgi:hypothetical protein
MKTGVKFRQLFMLLTRMLRIINLGIPFVRFRRGKLLQQVRLRRQFTVYSNDIITYKCHCNAQVINWAYLRHRRLRRQL